MLEIGSVIDGKYKILNQIGRGGTGVVYLAMNERANKFWAVKEVKKQDFREYEPDKKEIELMKRLKHPFLPSVVDVIEGEERLLIVMDYIEGRSLEDMVREEGAQPECQVLRWAGQLCQVLAYLHGQSPPVIYRDMKPANVIIKPDGNVTLIDFGAAREYDPQKRKDTILLGTYGYAAPEQYEARGQSDARTDIYCLGVLLFQILTGESPHKLRPVREVKPALSAGLEAVINKCTKVRREERYRNVKELQYALEYYWEQDEEYRRRQKRKLFAFAVPCVAAVCLGIGAGVFAGLEHHTRENSYEAFLQAAGNSVEKEAEIENYEKALSLDPAKEDAYLALLREGFLDDEVLTVQESEALRGVLMEKCENGQTREEIFRKNPKGYELFAYEAGIAYFYKYEERENKKYARNYFAAAMKSGKLEEAKLTRARRLYVVADYYAGIGKMDAAGDSEVTFRNYWEDLMALTEGNLVAEDNARTALVMYEELLGQILTHGDEFREAGVKREEVLRKMESVEQHLTLDFPEGVFTEERRELVRCIEGVRRIAASVFECKEE